MLVLRRAQMDVLREATVRRFSVTFARELADAYPQRWQALGAQARPALEDAIWRAIGFGLEDTPEIVRFCRLAFGTDVELGARPGHDWVREILAEPTMSPALKFDLLEERLAARGVAVFDGPTEREL